MGLLKFLFIAILVLWLLRMVVRLALPYMMRKVSEKMMGQAQEQYQQRYQGHPHSQSQRPEERRPEGKITIDYIPPKPRQKEGPKKAGEFVDYEEIK